MRDIHWKGHAFLFDRRRSTAYGSGAGLRLLAIFCFLEYLVGPRMSICGFLHLATPLFAAIFATGLFFAVLFQRSGNLWMVGIIHGIGNSYIDGTHRG